MTQEKPFITRNISSARKLWASLSESKFLVQSTSILVASNVIVALLGLIRTPLITWVFPKNEVGMIGVVTSWLPFIQLISMSGIDTAAYHFVTKGHKDAFIVGVRQRFLWSLLGCVGFCAGAVYWFLSDSPELGFRIVLVPAGGKPDGFCRFSTRPFIGYMDQ